jgi:hypothetical protein
LEDGRHVVFAVQVPTGKGTDLEWQPLLERAGGYIVNATGDKEKMVRSVMTFFICS